MKAFPLTTLDRMERIGQIGYVADSQAMLPTNGGQISDPRFLWGLHLRIEGRATMPASGGPTALSADGIAAILERLTIQGYHRIRARNEKFFDLRGADAKYISDFFTLGNVSSLPASFSFAASATNDFRINIVVPFVPLGIPGAEAMSYLLDTPNYDQLQLILQWGDPASMFGAGTAPTLTAFGSATGAPQCYVNGRFALAGANKFASMVPGRVFRYFVEVSGSIPTTTQTGQYVQQIPRGNIMRGIWAKTGVKSTTVTGGNNAYASLTDTALANLKVMRGTNYPIRFYPHQQDIGLENTLKRGFPYRPGYAFMDFAANGFLAESLNARGLQAGGTAQTDLYIQADVTGAANQAFLFAWEEIQALPTKAV